jgi:hypothetical protein
LAAALTDDWPETLYLSERAIRGILVRSVRVKKPCHPRLQAALEASLPSAGRAVAGSDTGT